MKKLFKLMAFVMLGHFATAQSYTHDYFPEELLKAENVRSVSIYESWIENPTDYSGYKNRLRLAKNLVNESYFAETGKKTRTLFFRPNNETIKDYLIFNYDDEGRLSQRDYYYPENENGTGNMLARHYKYNYRKKEIIEYKVVTNGDMEKEATTDSIAFAYDGQDRLTQERQYIFDENGPKLSLVKVFEHKGKDETVVTIKSGEEVIGREMLKYDGKGRVISISYFAGEDETARYGEDYIYEQNDRGWLQEVSYRYDWDHHKRAESVISRKNKYDDHGKLVEAQLDYGDGRRQMRYVDYAHFVQER